MHLPKNQLVVLSALMFLTTTVSEAICAELKAPRPNIILILCDDMGFSDLGCYGSEIETPNLDKLAANGVRFTDFHNNAKCSQTRASLLSGLWHQQSNNLRKPGHVTLAEVLKSAGYTTLMSGKWHLANTPPERGFDRYFGFLGGAINFFTGLNWGTGENQMQLDNQVYTVPDRFYSTDAFTDYAIQFIDQADHSDKPFFLYLAHNAPHFPLQALPEDIAKYKGRYHVGWDTIREQRYTKLQKLGLIDDTWRLSPRDPKVEPWSDITPEQAEFLEPMMEVYAAMVDRLDQNIGRLVGHLKKQGKLENTLILFLSDNGACPYQRLRTPHLKPGPAESNIAYDARWAHMCNTPLRLYKQYAHEGGSSTPMIAHWPYGIKARGELCRTTSHLIDIFPTLLELTGAKYPEEFNGKKIHPLEGMSLVSSLKNPSNRVKRKGPLFWEFTGHHAIREGDWKLVAEKSKDWELYDLSRDRSETINLAEKETAQVRRLALKYDQWARKVGAVPHTKAAASPPRTQSQLFDLP